MSIVVGAVFHLFRVLGALGVGLLVALVGLLFFGLVLVSLFSMPLSFLAYLAVVVAPALLVGGYVSARRITPGSIVHPAIAAAVAGAAWAIGGEVRPFWPGFLAIVGSFVSGAALGAYLGRLRQRAISRGDGTFRVG